MKRQPSYIQVISDSIQQTASTGWKTSKFKFPQSAEKLIKDFRILRHLITHCPLLPPATQKQLLSIPVEAGRAALLTELNNSSRHFPLSQFPHLLSGAITFPVPVFTTWGLIEDYEVIEKFRTGEYEVHNLNVIDEANTRVIDVSGVKLRLFGLGGTLAPNKMCQ